MKLKLVVYCDQDKEPLTLPTVTAPNTVSHLIALIEQHTKRRTKLLSYWNYRSESYQTLEKVEQLRQPEAAVRSGGGNHNNHNTAGGGGGSSSSGSQLYRAQLWVETALLVLEPLDPTRDVQEFAELTNHVHRWTGNKYVTFDLQQAARVYYPYLARRFDETRTKELHDGKEDVRLLYYSNNAWTTTQAVQFGFLLREDVPAPGAGGIAATSRPGSPSPVSTPRGGAANGDPGNSSPTNTKQNPFIFSSSMLDPETKHPALQERHKVLLCEVAPGRPWLSDVPLMDPSALRTPPDGYDSIYFEEETNMKDSRTKAMRYTRQMPPLTQVRISRSHQALPRYVLTVLPRKREQPAKGCGRSASSTDRFVLDPTAEEQPESALFRRPSGSRAHSMGASRTSNPASASPRARSAQPQGHTRASPKAKPLIPATSTDSAQSSTEVLSVPVPPPLPASPRSLHTSANNSFTYTDQQQRPSQVRASFRPIEGTSPMPRPQSLVGSVNPASGKLYSTLPTSTSSAAPPALIPTSEGNGHSPQRAGSQPTSARSRVQPPPSVSRVPASASDGMVNSASRQAPPGNLSPTSPRSILKPRSGPLPAPSFAAHQPSVNLRCAVHNAQATTLFCRTCRELVCPYCASVGIHKGHDVMEAEEEAQRVRSAVQELCHDLSQWLDHFRRVERQLVSERDSMQRRHQQRAQNLHGQLEELRRALNAKEQALLRQLEDSKQQMAPPVAEAAQVRQKYARALAPLEQALQTYEAGPSQGRAGAAALQFLKVAPRLMREALHFFKVRDRREEEKLRESVTAVKAAGAQVDELLTSLPINELREQITALGQPGGGGGGRRGDPALLAAPARQEPSIDLGTPRTGGRYDEWSTTTPSRGTSALRRPSASPSRGNGGGGNALALVERCLLDLQRGHIWTIENASSLFCPGQNRAVCSTPFRLLGVDWELRIGTLPQDPKQGYLDGPGANRKRQPSPRSYDLRQGAAVSSSWLQDGPAEEDQWLGLFLLPQGHQMRLDFRLIAFSEVTWTEWKVTGWSTTYVGRGWGLYPFLRRQDLMRTDKLARDNTVKICIAPLSDLY